MVEFMRLLEPTEMDGSGRDDERGYWLGRQPLSNPTFLRTTDLGTPPGLSSPPALSFSPSADSTGSSLPSTPSTPRPRHRSPAPSYDKHKHNHSHHHRHHHHPTASPPRILVRASEPNKLSHEKDENSTATATDDTAMRTQTDDDGSRVALPTLKPASSAHAAEPAEPSPRGGRVEWDWDVEHADRAREREADANVHNAQPFQVDRRVLKDVVQEKMGEEVGRIRFMGSGTFNKAYLITLASGRELVARVARRFMPRLKTSSEVATMHYLRTHTSVPVPDVYHYDANPYNRLGGEFILMSKAPGIPLSRVYHSMSHKQLLRLMDNAAALLVPLFGHRFNALGSLYLGAEKSSSSTTPATPSSSLGIVPPSFAQQMQQHPLSPSTPTPTAAFLRTPTLSSYMATPTAPTPRFESTPRAGASVVTPGALASLLSPPKDVHVGPIVSWPFFGSGRGDLQHPDEIDRGPWKTTYDYLMSCAQREIRGVIRENEGKSAPHRLHLDPDEVQSSRHHKMRGVPGDQSDDSTEWDWEESESEWEGGPGASMYRDYRRMQRSTFLVAHMRQREQAVGQELERWIAVMERLGVGTPGDGEGGGGSGERHEEFALDCHDLNLENVFVDEHDHASIACIIDWESTTTRPLWQSAHVPAFAQSSPFTAKLFRAAVARLAETSPDLRTASYAQEWLDHEARGARLRAAHRFVEWDGWEEGLVETILGPEEAQEETWFKEWEAQAACADTDEHIVDGDEDGEAEAEGQGILDAPEVVRAWRNAQEWAEADASGMATGSASPPDSLSDARSSPPTSDDTNEAKSALGDSVPPTLLPLAVPVQLRGRKPRSNSIALTRPDERERERLLDATGDLCGGRGGELGRRLEAWLYSVHGDAAMTD